MNFTYSVVTPADGEFGSLSNGNWTGLIRDVLSGKAHVVVAFLTQTYSRSQVIDYSSVLIKFSYRIFAKPETMSSVSWSSYTRPFSTGLWVGLALSLLVLAAVFSCVSHWYCLQEIQKTTKSWKTKEVEAGVGQVLQYQEMKKDSLLLMWAAITQQGWPNPPDVGYLRVLFWMVYVMGMVVVAAYSATLVSFLTVVDSSLPFDSLADLRRLRKYRLGILKGSVLEEFFRNPSFQEYWDNLIEPYSNTLAKSYQELRERAIQDSRYAYVGSYEVQRLDLTGACTFDSARQHLLFNDGALGWPGGSPYVELFDYHINKFREAGLLHKMLNTWYPQAYSCVNLPVIPLGFQQVFTAFVMLGLGVGLSVLLLCVEKLFSKSNNNKHYKNQVYKNHTVKSKGPRH